MKALITGIDGFTGRYLAAALNAAGYQVYGLVEKPPQTEIACVQSAYACDLGDFPRLAEVLDMVKPDVVVHLAAISFVAHGDVEAIYRTNLVGSRNLLEALSHCGSSLSAVLLASSANVYGNASREVLDENTPFAPANDYAVSKLAMEYMARLYAERLPLIVVRPFNYTGVGQSDNFLLPKIVSHFRRHAPVIELGNLDVARDFSDVRMVVDCYLRLLQTPAAVGGLFNVCSGVAYTLTDVLRMAESISGHSLEVRVNPAFVRANEVKILCGDRAHLESTIGSVKAIPLETTLRWMLEAPVCS